ncbi:MAG: hypothetical protein MJZ12_02510 [Prevotella sp.]|nr:hypothetical protein [Prevotella sp.]
MKKILFFFAALLCSFEVINAQVNFVATLQHGDVVSHYYGQTAFNQAYTAAANGDIITLSPGTFTFSTKNFNKGITLRGAGIDADERTYISSDVDFYSSDENLVTNIEGIWFSGANVNIYNNSDETSHGKIKFIKNGFSGDVRITYTGTATPTITGPSIRFYNSIINRSFYLGNAKPDCIVCNSYVRIPYSALLTSTISGFVNCVINLADYSYTAKNSYMNFYNCIFNWGDYSYSGLNYNYYLPSTATCYNCLSINKSTLFNNIVSGTNNKYLNSASQVFKTYRSSYSKGETFELTDSVKEKYLGTDGKEIGMHGALSPYTSTVQYPVITKFNSASQTTKEGKLDIEIQVDGK